MIGTRPVHVVYLIGQPGAGKTTLVDLLLRAVPVLPRQQPVPHLMLKGGVHLGFRGQFGGTDTLSLSIQPKVLDWLAKPNAPRVVLGEGDRLANTKFFDGVGALGCSLTVVDLATPDALAAERRTARAGSGKQQNATWVRGRITKIHGLRASGYVSLTLDGTLAPEALVEQLKAQVQAVRVLTGEMI